MVSSRSALRRRWFSARAVKVNGKSSALRRLGRGGDPLDRVAQLVDARIRIPVLDRASDRSRLGRSGDRPGGVLGGGPVPVLEVDGDRQRARLVERPGVLGDLVERHVAVEAAEREREAAAGGRERLEPEPLEHPGRPGIPGVGEQERLALVERSERLGLLELGWHPDDLLASLARLLHHFAPLNELPEHVLRNRTQWDAWAEEYVRPGRENWESEEPSWGIWGIPESRVGILPPDLEGRDTIELGCGTGYVSAWLARRGARPVGIDNSPAQLETARAFQREFGLDFPLLHGNAEDVPYPDASFDYAISEYGASIWCDPYEWIPEAARLLRPGGRLAFLVNSPLLIVCSGDLVDDQAEERLMRPYFGMHRFEWPDDASIEFHLPHGELIALLRRSGFEIEELLELQPPEDATTRYEYVTLEWARRWPSEEVWKVRKARG